VPDGRHTRPDTGFAAIGQSGFCRVLTSEHGFVSQYSVIVGEPSRTRRSFLRGRYRHNEVASFGPVRFLKDLVGVVMTGARNGEAGGRYKSLRPRSRLD
jgi:hypothetical protein